MKANTFFFRIRAVHKFENNNTTTQFFFAVAENKQQAIDYAWSKIGTADVEGLETKLFTRRKKVKL